MVHWEIVARDAEAQAAFYRELFNWDVGTGRIKDIPPGLGGPEPGPAGHIRPGREPSIALYVQVKDLRHALDRAKRLGATITAEPFDVPGGPTLAGITDPEGNRLVLVQQ
jgi:predicted enzyme related to lactoylglutathione lyase